MQKYDYLDEKILAKHHLKIKKYLGSGAFGKVL